MKQLIMAGLSALAGAVAGGTGAGIVVGKQSSRNQKLANKHLALYLMMNQWVKVKQENKSIAEYLESKGYKEIAIYGMNYVGETLLNELANSDVKVKYGIDKNAGTIYSFINVVTPDDNLAEVDAIVVTPITFYDEIKELLSSMIECPILSIEDILYNI